MRSRANTSRGTPATKRSIFKNLLIAGVFALGAQAVAQATPLLEYQGNHFGGPAMAFTQQLARVDVEAADVQIGGFGVFGQAQSTMNIGWVIFDIKNLQTPVFMSGPQQVNGSATPMWYTISAPFTLLAGQQYAMGVVAEGINAGGFKWGLGSSSDGATTMGGLTLLAKVASVQPGVCDNAGGWACGTTRLSSFLAEPYPDLLDPNFNPFNKMSLQIAPVPEPSEWAMLVAGLLLLGFVAGRRKQSIDSGTDDTAAA
jgi:hypothetical protein